MVMRLAAQQGGMCGSQVSKLRFVIRLRCPLPYLAVPYLTLSAKVLVEEGADPRAMTT